GELEGVVRAVGVDEQGLDREPGVAARARRAGEVIDTMDGLGGEIRRERPGHIVLDEPESGMVPEMRELLAGTGEEVVHGGDVMDAMGGRGAEVRREGPGHIVLDEPESGMVREMREILAGTGEEVVHGGDVMAIREQAVDEV